MNSSSKISLLREDESGLALMITVFVLALASILVVDMMQTTAFDQRQQRGFSERIQADFILKSSINFGRILIELPPLEPDIQEDWLGDPWASIAAQPTLPISGFKGNLRLMIVDQDGKIDLNAILGSQQGLSGGSTAPLGGTTSSGGQQQFGDLSSDYWKTVLEELFQKQGFGAESYGQEDYQTLGNRSFSASDQVAVIHDWIDRDRTSHQSSSFTGVGIESGAKKTWFFNRPLRNLSELLLVPGITPERVARIAPFVKVSSMQTSLPRVNVNTAPIEVLMAMGFDEGEVVDMALERRNLPIDSAILQKRVAGNQLLAQHTKVTSNEFAIFARVEMPNVTRWAHAVVSARGTRVRRISIVNQMEIQ